MKKRKEGKASGRERRENIKNRGENDTRKDKEKKRKTKIKVGIKGTENMEGGKD